MNQSVEVNQSNFVTEVIERSQTQLVLVDFFAHWCGPCQVLKPILEKLVKEYDFVLAKVDIDQNPELANTYQVQGVPDVRICTGGEMRSGFVGVLPEQQIRQLLEDYNLKSNLDLELKAIQLARVAGDIEVVKQQFNQLIQQYPDNPQLMGAASEFLIGIGSLQSAEKLIDTLSTQREYYSQAQALRELIQLKHADQLVIETELDRQYAQAVQLTLRGDYQTALSLLLEIVERDRKYKNDAARKAMVTIFGLLGDEHQLTKNYRKQLMLALY